ncbi:hypothetical protein FRB90_011634 [Tulasnella sp. 427]|nr:hypothetical protein FRB90_011634 [Tulasnella sp. 427]
MSFSAQQALPPPPALTKLRESLSGEIVRPGEEGYEYGIARWSNTHVKQAAYVAFPKTNQDVSQAIAFAKELGLEIAVCGGGHSFSGSSSTQGGLVIRLGKYLNQARCDPERREITVGGGATWEIVDNVGMEHGLATVSSNVNNVGVGGLALGGGYGWLTGRHGMVVDNIVQLTVVLASGEVVIANDNENPDLFWGCRGGGGNFGIVTEFVFKAHPQRPTVFVTHLVYTMDKLESVFNTVEDWYKNAGPDEGLHWGCGVLPGVEPAQPTVIVTYFYNGETVEGRKAAKKLYDIGPIAEHSVEDLPFVKLNALENDAAADGGRKFIMGLKSRSTTSLDAIKLLLRAQDELVQTNPSLVHCGFQLDYTPKQAVIAVPVGTTAYAGRGAGAECIIYQAYTDSTLDDFVQTQVRQWAQILLDNAPVHEQGEEFFGVSYGNIDPDAVGSDAARVFGQNYARLKEIKRRFDPENVWNRWYPIEPAESY